MNSTIYIILGIIILYAIYVLFFQIDRYHGGGGGIGAGGMPPRSAIRGGAWGGYGYPSGWGGWGGGCCGRCPRECANCIGDYDAVSQEQNTPSPS